MVVGLSLVGGVSRCFFDEFIFGLVLPGLLRGMVGMCVGGVLILVVLFVV